MRNSITKLQRRIYFSFVLFFGLLLFVIETLQLKIALNRELSVHYYIIPVTMGAAFGWLLAHLKILSTKIKVEAVTDHLTQLYNRSWVSDNITSHFENFKRYSTSLSIILVDIDNFKQINDTYGHAVGDEVLVRVAELLEGTTRATDYCCRWGGEEFLVILPSTKIEGARVKAENLRQAIADEWFSFGSISCSFGVAELESDEQEEGDLVHNADLALYQAKHSGKNCVRSFSMI